MHGTFLPKITKIVIRTFRQAEGGHSVLVVPVFYGMHMNNESGVIRSLRHFIRCFDGLSVGIDVRKSYAGIDGLNAFFQRQCASKVPYENKLCLRWRRVMCWPFPAVSWLKAACVARNAPPGCLVAMFLESPPVLKNIDFPSQRLPAFYHPFCAN